MTFRNLARGVLRNFRQQWRMLVRHHNFDGESGFRPTRVTMLSKENESNIYIEAYSPVGFRLNSGIRIIGPCALFPRSLLHWNVKSAEDINEDSLSLFCILAPKLDILLLGIGNSGAKFDPGIIKYLKSKKINVEILPTDQACSTFNFLNAESRIVACGLIPPDYIHMDEDEDILLQAQLEQRDLYSLKHGYSEVPETSGVLQSELEDFQNKIFPSAFPSKKEDDAEKKTTSETQKEKDKK